MDVLKSKTIGGKTYELRRTPTDRGGKQYEYYVTESGGRIDDPVYTRERGMQQWRETVQAIRRAEGKERSNSRSDTELFGFGNVEPRGNPLGDIIGTPDETTMGDDGGGPDMPFMKDSDDDNEPEWPV